MRVCVQKEKPERTQNIVYYVCVCWLCLFGCLFMRFYETCLAADVYEYQTDVAHFCMHDFLFSVYILKRGLFIWREKLSIYLQ